MVVMSMIPPARPPRREPRPTPSFVEPTAPISSPTRRRGPESPAPGIRFSDVLNFLNPAPSLTSAVAEGRAPKPADVALDAGLFAAGFIPFAGPGIKGAGQAARAGAINRRIVPEGGPEAVSEFLGAPKTGYYDTLNRSVLADTLESGEQFIPRGSELIRMPSRGQVSPRRGSQSVPLPREVGADYIAGRPQSFGQSGDLQRMGAIMRGLGPDTGGDIWRAPGLMSITAREDLPGLIDLPGFLAKYASEISPGFRHPLGSKFSSEGLLAPNVRLQLRDFNPGDFDRLPLTSPLNMGDFNFPTWYFDAFAR
jgi:hypothetical protein